MPLFRTQRAVGRALVVVAALALAACDSVEERIAKHYESGVALEADGEYERAALEFRNALKLNENHAPSRREIGKLYERDREIAAAVSNYRLAAELDGQDVESRVRLAMLLALGGALEEARANVMEALAISPEDPEALVALATVDFRDGDVDGAVANAQRALALDPGNVDAILTLANIDIERGDTAAALARLDGLLAEKPDELSANLLKLRALEIAEDGDSLVEHLGRMTEIYPETDAFPIALARLHAQRGETEEAEAVLRLVAERDPSDTNAALNVVRFLASAHGADAAREELQARIASAGDASEAASFSLALADLERSAGDMEAARAVLEGVIADNADADSADRARLRLAGFFAADGDIAEAEKLIAPILERDEGNAGALALRAALRIDQERPNEAVIDIRRALQVDPENVQYMLLESRAHERAGSPELAGERLGAAVRASNYRPDIAIAYARLLRGGGQTESALNIIDEALKRAPQNRALLTSLAELSLAVGDWDRATEIAETLRTMPDGGEGAANQITAAALSAQGRTEDTVAVLEDMIEDEATRDGALTALVATHVRSGDLERARTLVDEALEKSPDDGRALLLRSELRALEGDAEGAQTALRQLIVARPDEETGYIALSRLQMRLGDGDAALQTVMDGVGAVSNPNGLRFLQAQFHEQRREFDAAIDIYADLYGREPNNKVLANNLASLLAEHRADDPESLQRAQRLSQRLRGSDVPQFQDTYGWTMFLTGDYDEALRNLSQAAEALPDNPIVRYHAGRAFAHFELWDEARANLEAALRIDATYTPAARALAALPEAAAPAEGQ